MVSLLTPVAATQMFPYPHSMSSDSLQSSPSEKLINDSANSYLPTPYDEPTWVQSEVPTPDRPFPFTPSVSSTAPTQYNGDDCSWMYPEELVGAPVPLESMQSPLDVSPTLQTYDSAPNTHSTRRTSNVDLPRITEHETWNLTALDNDIENRESTYQSTPSPSQHQFINSPSVFPTRILRRSSSDALSNQQGGKPNGRSRPSSSCEDPTPPKRRRSYSGGPEKKSPLNEDDAVVREPRAKSTLKSLGKAPHSIVERRYRENLNTRMNQLDLMLTAIHDRTRKAGDLDVGPRHTEMAGKTRKADVLSDAIRYVKQADLEGASKTKEIDFLKLRIAALEKLVHSVTAPF